MLYGRAQKEDNPHLLIQRYPVPPHGDGQKCAAAGDIPWVAHIQQYELPSSELPHETYSTCIVFGTLIVEVLCVPVIK